VEELIAKRYIKALLSDSDLTFAENVTVLFESLAQSFNDEKFLNIVTNSEVAAADKTSLLLEIVKPAESDRVNNFMKLLVENKRINIIPAIAEELRKNLAHASKTYTGNNFDWVKIQQDIKEYGIRNFLLVAIAPNTSTSSVMGVSASYLPVYSKFNYETFASLQVPVLARYIKDKYWVYKTRYQYKVKELIDFTTVLQEWVDTGISMELNMDEVCFRFRARTVIVI